MTGTRQKEKAQKKHTTLGVKSDIEDCSSTVQGAETGERTRFRSDKERIWKEWTTYLESERKQRGRKRGALLCGLTSSDDPTPYLS